MIEFINNTGRTIQDGETIECFCPCDFEPGETLQCVELGGRLILCPLQDADETVLVDDTILD